MSDEALAFLKANEAELAARVEAELRMRRFLADTDIPESAVVYPRTETEDPE